MPGTSVASSLLSGLVSITAKDVGKKVGLAVMADLFSSPLDFLFKMGLSELFGGSSEADFSKVFAKLDQIESEIEAAAGRISALIEESGLEEEHSELKTLFSNLKTAAISNSDITTGYAAAYDSFFSHDIVETLDEINKATQGIHDRLLGEASISEGYISTVATNMFGSNTDMYAFNTRLTAIAALYQTDLLHATLVLASIALHATDPLHKTKAGELIQQIGTYTDAIGAEVTKYRRDVGIVAESSESIHFMLNNPTNNEILARYAALKHNSRSLVTSFEMHHKGDGYYYLKVAGKDVGIDHYYGKDIRPVRKGDSGHPNHIWKFDPAPSDPTRYYRIVNKATGAALDHYYGKEIKGAPCDEHPNHLWEVLPHEDGNTCCIVNKATGDLLCYDLSHNRFNGFNAHYGINVGHYNSGFPIEAAWRNACWHFVRHDNGEFHNLVNSHNGECLDHYDGESFRFVGSPSGHPNHQWKLEPTAIGDTQACFFVRNKATSAVLDAYYGKSLGGAGDTNATNPNGCHIWQVDRK